MGFDEGSLVVDHRSLQSSQELLQLAIVVEVQQSHVTQSNRRGLGVELLHESRLVEAEDGLGEILVADRGRRRSPAEEDGERRGSCEQVLDLTRKLHRQTLLTSPYWIGLHLDDLTLDERLAEANP